MSTRYLCTSIGRKQMMALTGLAWCGFVFVHMIGNLLYFGGSEVYNDYSEALTSNREIYYAIEVGLLLTLVLHIFFAALVVLQNRSARPVGYAVGQNHSAKTAATFASRTMAYTGTLVLLFIIFHLIHFRFGAYYPIQGHGKEIRDIARLVREFFQNGYFAGVYVAFMAVLTFHLQHALWSSLQTLGWIPGGKEPGIRKLSYAFGIVVSAGFALLPFYIFLFQRGAS